MTIALIDNGSLEPAAHRNLRAIASALGASVGETVDAVSWKHSDRIRPDLLGGAAALTLGPWVRRKFAAGERDFVFVPFFISAQGAIGSWLRRDVESLQRELGTFRFTFTTGLAAQGTLVRIVAARIRETIAAARLTAPAVILVDHGGPSTASATLRNHVAHDLRRALGEETGPLIAASMEGAEYAHCHPLFGDVLASAGFDRGEVVIAPLFLAPGRHAGPRGDLAQVVIAAEDRLTAPALHCHFAGLVGTHPDVVPALAAALTQTLTTFPAAA